MTEIVHVIGGGLAGSEASWQLAKAGVPVVLHEMRPVRGTEAHVTSQLAELVCSNSFRSDDAQGNAVGLLHEEMRRCGSIIMQAADANRVPAGGALAVDREGYAGAVEAAIEGQGVVLASSALVDGDLKVGRLVRPFPPSVCETTAFCYYLVYPEAKASDRKVTAFREWVLAEVAQA